MCDKKDSYPTENVFCQNLISKTPMELLLGYFLFGFMLQLHIVKFALEMKTTEYY